MVHYISALNIALLRYMGKEIELTAKEFDILALLILKPRRVFTYEMISDIVWKEEYNEYSRKAINNHISNLRRKLKVTPDRIRGCFRKIQSNTDFITYVKLYAP